MVLILLDMTHLNIICPDHMTWVNSILDSHNLLFTRQFKHSFHKMQFSESLGGASFSWENSTFTFTFASDFRFGYWPRISCSLPLILPVNRSVSTTVRYLTAWWLAMIKKCQNVIVNAFVQRMVQRFLCSACHLRLTRETPAMHADKILTSFKFFLIKMSISWVCAVNSMASTRTPDPSTFSWNIPLRGRPFI